MNDYREYLIGRGLSANTVRNYEGKLRRAAGWAEEHNTDLADLKPSEVVAITELWPRKHSSRRQLRSALVHYWEMLGVTGPVRAIRVPGRPRPRWRGLEDDAVCSLLEIARVDWPRGAVVYLGLYLGLRREKIATLRWRDFDADLGWVSITGKQDRTRSLPVHPRLQAILRPNRWPGEFVFPGRLGGHVSLTTINNWISQMGTEAGIGHIYPHQLRHTSGGKVNDETGDIYAAQGWLGHARVETTQTYTRLESKRLERAMRVLDWEDDRKEAA